MLTSEAHVRTEPPSRYLGQLCRHAQQVHRLRVRPRSHGGDGAQPLPEVRHVEWSDTRGIISFGWGLCTMQATADTLTLRAEAADERDLHRVEYIVAGNIGRFGRRDHLTLNWQRAPVSGAQPGEELHRQR